jgi:hypothetical protein
MARNMDYKSPLQTPSLLMESIATIPVIGMESYRKPLRLYVNPRQTPKPKRKPKPVYPKIIMPEQPVGYIRQREHDCL